MTGGVGQPVIIHRDFQASENCFGLIVAPFRSPYKTSKGKLVFTWVQRRTFRRTIRRVRGSMMRRPGLVVFQVWTELWSQKHTTVDKLYVRTCIHACAGSERVSWPFSRHLFHRLSSAERPCQIAGKEQKVV